MAAGKLIRFMEIPNLPTSPQQPLEFMFSKWPFGKVKVVYWSFQKSWLKERPFLHQLLRSKACSVLSYLCNSSYREEDTSCNCWSLICKWLKIAYSPEYSLHWDSFSCQYRQSRCNLIRLLSFARYSYVIFKNCNETGYNWFAGTSQI